MARAARRVDPSQADARGDVVAPALGGAAHAASEFGPRAPQAELRAATSEVAVLRALVRAAPPIAAFGDAPAHGPTPAYAVSKAALNALARIAAARLPSPDECGVRVSAVCPGDVRTRMLSTHDPQARRQALPPATAARDVVRLAVAGLDTSDSLPSGRFWRHCQELEL